MLDGVSTNTSKIYTSDCNNCDAICCIALDLVAKDYKKPKNILCHYLKTEKRKCAIYKKRAEHGFSCCIQFECYGAGQAVTKLFHKLYGRKSTSTKIGNLKNDIFVATLLTLGDKLELKYKNKIAVNSNILNALRPFLDAAITLIEERQ